MADPSLFDPLRMPAQALVGLDWRPYHFAIQPYHYLIRMMHVVASGAFFGGVGLLDAKLMGWPGTVPLRGFVKHVMPWLWATFGVVVVTGVALFFYDPVHVGSHAYWTPKLIAIALGGLNTLFFRRTGFAAALAAEYRMPATARIAGAVSLVCWTAAFCFACMNVEGVPKVLLEQ